MSSSASPPPPAGSVGRTPSHVLRTNAAPPQPPRPGSAPVDKLLQHRMVSQSPFAKHRISTAIDAEQSSVSADAPTSCAPSSPPGRRGTGPRIGAGTGALPPPSTPPARPQPGSPVNASPLGGSAAALPGSPGDRSRSRVLAEQEFANFQQVQSAYKAPRKSQGYRKLQTEGHVSSSPFKSEQDTSLASIDSTTDGRPASSMLTTEAQATHDFHDGSDASYNPIALHQRRKTVTFDEELEVQEFRLESSYNASASSQSRSDATRGSSDADQTKATEGMLNQHSLSNGTNEKDGAPPLVPAVPAVPAPHQSRERDQTADPSVLSTPAPDAHAPGAHEAVPSSQPTESRLQQLVYRALGKGTPAPAQTPAPRSTSVSSQLTQTTMIEDPERDALDVGSHPVMSSSPPLLPIERGQHNRPLPPLPLNSSFSLDASRDAGPAVVSVPSDTVNESDEKPLHSKSPSMMESLNREAKEEAAQVQSDNQQSSTPDPDVTVGPGAAEPLPCHDKETTQNTSSAEEPANHRELSPSARPGTPPTPQAVPRSPQPSPQRVNRTSLLSSPQMPLQEDDSSTEEKQDKKMPLLSPLDRMIKMSSPAPAEPTGNEQHAETGEAPTKHNLAPLSANHPGKLEKNKGAAPRLSAGLGPLGQGLGLPTWGAGLFQELDIPLDKVNEEHTISLNKDDSISALLPPTSLLATPQADTTGSTDTSNHPGSAGLSSTGSDSRRSNEQVAPTDSTRTEQEGSSKTKPSSAPSAAHLRTPEENADAIILQRRMRAGKPVKPRRSLSVGAVPPAASLDRTKESSNAAVASGADLGSQSDTDGDHGAKEDHEEEREHVPFLPLFGSGGFVETGAEKDFGQGLQRELSRIQRKDRPYRMRKRQTISVRDTEPDEVPALPATQQHAAQTQSHLSVPASPNKAFRKARKSDMTEYTEELAAFRRQEDPQQAVGKVFVRVESFHPQGLPLPAKPTRFELFLNNGLNEVKAARGSLLVQGNPTAQIGQEFELLQHKGLQFTLTLRIIKDAHLRPQTVEVPIPPPSPQKNHLNLTRSISPVKQHAGGRDSPVPSGRNTPLSEPQSPSKEKKETFFSRLLRSPKKKRTMDDSFNNLNSRSDRPATPSPRPLSSPTKAQPAPPAPTTRTVTKPPEPLLSYMNHEGDLGRAQVNFEAVAEHMLGQKYVLELPLVGVADFPASLSSAHGGRRGTATTNPSMSSEFDHNLSRSRGTLQVSMFFVPSVKGITAHTPSRLSECEKGMHLARGERVLKKQGVLTQMGGGWGKTPSVGNKTWRRRKVELRGARLLCRNEVTNKVVTDVSLVSAVAVEGVKNPVLSNETSQSPRKSGSDSDVLDDEFYEVERSFRLRMADGEVLRFYADSDEDKTAWMEVLRQTIVECAALRDGRVGRSGASAAASTGVSAGIAPLWAQNTLSLAEAVSQGTVTLAQAVAPRFGFSGTEAGERTFQSAGMTRKQSQKHSHQLASPLDGKSQGEDLPKPSYAAPTGASVDPHDQPLNSSPVNTSAAAAAAATTTNAAKGSMTSPSPATAAPPSSPPAPTSSSPPLSYTQRQQGHAMTSLAARGGTSLPHSPGKSRIPVPANKIPGRYGIP